MVVRSLFLKHCIRYWKGKSGLVLSSTPYIDLTACCRHCADAVLSLSNPTTMVGIVSSRITDFAALWTQTPSNYDWLVANGLRSDFVHPHGPVLSHQGGKHFIYSKYNFSRPGGALVWCHNSVRKLEHRSHFSSFFSLWTLSSPYLSLHFPFTYCLIDSILLLPSCSLWPVL